MIDIRLTEKQAARVTLDWGRRLVSAVVVCKRLARPGTYEVLATLMVSAEGVHVAYFNPDRAGRLRIVDLPAWGSEVVRITEDGAIREGEGS